MDGVGLLVREILYLHPLDLAALAYLESLALANFYDSKGNMAPLWKSTICWRDKNLNGLTIAKNIQQADIQNMIRQLIVGSIDDSSFFNDWGEERARLGLPRDFDHLLPRDKMALLAGTGAVADVIGNFLRLGARVNCARSVEDSIRCVSAGINSYATFRSLVCKPPLPPTDGERFDTGLDFQAGRDL